MKSKEIREAFLRFFEKHGHMRVKSSSLVPHNDPTLFFTNAGMVQFKDVFLGQEKRAYTRAASAQKCMRVSGKHNDLENVGHTPRHHTFFEMLGNFSFGDYFKKDAIAFAWEFLTKEMGLDGKCLYVTVFREDSDAEKLWLPFVKRERIFRMDEEDNFWAMGETGPCGPCSEIIWDFGKGEVKKEDLNGDRFMEIWNLVFMQFNRDEKGNLKQLTAPSIDTGMGLERLATVIQGVKSNWDTDLFVPIIEEAARVTGQNYGESPDVDVALRVIADHIRGASFLIADGVIPSNEGRGYVLRRILRRAIRYGKRLGCDSPFMALLAHIVVDEMGGFYPELAEHRKFIEKVVSAEDEKFYTTLDKGLELLKGEMKRAKKKIISGDVAFKLSDTYGFPLDVTAIIAAENGFSVDEAGFAKLMEAQRELSRASWKGSGEEKVLDVYKNLKAKGVRSQFVGYTSDSAEALVLAIIDGGKCVEDAALGSEVQFVTDQTPFYGESGGQKGDTGLGVTLGLEIEIADARKPFPDLTVHFGRVKRGTLKVGETITLAIESEERQKTRCNHTATHLLHRALREVLGEHVKQSGSLVTPQRLRFDFSHFQALTRDELKDVERHVNEAIRKNFPVITNELSYDEAVKQGALAFFGEKYGDRVRMIDISGFSRELCGGTHVSATGELGILKIVSESSVAAGVRRIEAITGAAVDRYVEDLEQERSDIANAIKSQPSEVLFRVKKLVENYVELERKFRAQQSRGALEDSGDLAGKARDVGGVKVLAVKVDAPDRAVLAGWAERYRDKLGESVVVLACCLDGKAHFVVAVSKSLNPKVHAGKIVGALSEAVGGKGGGRPDFAQGGGTDCAKIEDALKKVRELVKNSLQGRDP